MSVADSAVGAILEIPPQALGKIKDAERAIWSLHDASKKAADQVYGDFSKRMPMGVDVFIERLKSAVEEMRKINGAKIDFSVNTQGLDNQLNNVSNAAKRTATDVSSAVQTLAMQNLDFTNIQRLSESIMALDGTYKQVETTIKSLERGRASMATESTEAQATTNMIQLLKEYLELKKKSDEQQKTKTTVFDQNILSEQKTLLTQILQLQKDIDAESRRQERVSALGKTIPQEDIDKLKNYKTELDRLAESYGNLRGKIDEMSTAGQKRFNEAEVKADLALARERTDAQDKLNQALQMTSKYTSETKLKSAGISSREEGIYMNELVGVYQQMIAMIKKRGEVEAQVASQGYAQTSAQTNLLQTIQTEYDRLNASLANVTGKYTEIDRAVKSMFENAKTMQEAENAAKLADALQKAADAADKKSKADAKTAQTDLSKDRAEYKRVLTLIEQIEKAQRKVNEALASATLPANLAQQLQSSQAAAEASLNNLYNRKAEIEAKRGQELVDIQQQNEAKKGATAVAEHKKAEEEKTRISKQEATERYTEEMRQARLQNQALTAQGKQQRMSINDAKEQRAIELAQQRQKEIERLRKEIDALDKKDVNYQKDLDRLNQRINELLGTTQRHVSYTREEAMAMAKSATTLRQLEAAYKALKDAMATTDPKSQQWRDMNTQLQQTKTHIDEIKKKMGEFQSQSRQTSNVMGQLQSRIAAAFSVGAIMGFIKKMTEVRAQFELQRVALGAIIQDRDEANKIFTQVQNMALESPFNIMQLEKATKQIAAFGFETQKLVPTMKMFADISAGLGVEIDRLVLVMGHLKARNFLEGTMVRQFTNMGFNVLGELSKYYTELEDRMVSVGEVQDRVKKKMVSFEDVEEVLKRVTSAGGMFYDMQKKQSDSLWGQMQRIQDAYDLMLNEIGQSNEGILKSALTTIRNLINSWRTLKPIIVSVVAAMGTFGAAMFILRGIPMLVANIVRGFRMMGAAIGVATKEQLALNAAQRANAWGLLLSLIVAVGVALYEVATTTSKLNEELNRIGEETSNSLDESIVTLKTLADTISDTNSTYTERTEAMNEMRRVYAEILPKEKLEIDYIQSLRGNYAELTKTIQDYYQQKEYNQKVEAIQGSNEAQAVQKQLEETLNRMNEEGAFDMKYSKAMIKSWSDTIAKEINTGKIPATLDSLEARIKEVFNAKDISLFRGENYGEADLTDVMQEVEKVQKAYGDITLETANAENALTSYQNALKKFDFSQLDDAKKSLQEQKDSLQQAIDSGRKGFQGTAGGRPIYGTMQMDASEIEALQERLKGVEAQIQAVDDAEREWLSNQFKEKVEELNQVLFKDVEAYKAAQDEMRKLEMQGKKNTTEWKKLEMAMTDARKSADKTAETYGTKVNWALIDSAQTSFELRGELDKLATQAFPKVAEKAMKSMNKVIEYFLKAKGKAYEFVKGLLDWIPEEMRNAVGINKILENVDKRLALTKTQLDNLAKAAEGVENNTEDAGKSFGKMVSDKTITRAKQFGANVKTLDDIVDKAGGSAEQAAKDLRSSAKIWEETVKSYQTSTDKDLWLAARPEQTKESIALMEKNAKAAKALATDLAGVEKSSKSKKGGKGKDEIAELWKNRLKAIQDFYKRYEELREHFTADESLTRAKDAFQGLFNVLNMDMDKVVAMGMDKQGLANNIKDMLNVVRKIRPQLADEFEKAFADVQIQVDFKVAEDAEKKLKQDLDEMFASYELTEELKKIGVNVDLTYMVGGKPTTLEDIQNEIARLKKEGGDKEDAKNRIKTLEEAEKRITQMELKAQKERLKNYEKYLKKAYSDSARVQLEYFVKLQQMQEDFAKAEKDLNEQLANPETSVEDRLKIQKALKNLPKQASRAAKGMREEMDKELDKLNLDRLLKSPLFAEMFQDLGSMTNKVLDTMLVKIRDIQKSSNDLSLSQIRQLAQYAEKIENAKLDNSPFKEAYDAIKKAYELRAKGITAKSASDSLAVSEEELERLETLKNDISFILGIKEKSYKIDGENVIVGGKQIKLTEQQISLLGKSTTELNKQLDVLQDQSGELDGSIKKQKQIVIVNGQNVQVFKNALTATEKLSNALKKSAEAGKEAINAVTAGMQMFGKEVSESDQEWLDFVGNMMDAGIELAIMFVALGATINNALGIIGIISTALTFVAGLFKAIFQSHDKRLEEQIGRVQDRVDALSKAFKKLEKSIERAFTIADENRMTEQALSNLEAQKKAYQEMIRLEEEKKDSDYDKIKEYQDKIEELGEAEEELYEKRHEKWGSTNDVWGEANNWVDAWLDAYKETADGLDALNESWDKFYENLVKKQAVSAIVGKRMQGYIDRINDVIDSNMDEYSMVDAFKEIGKDFKNDAASWNKALKEFFEYAGIGGGAGELILSDLQKGIQNITEPQAAAIEAYLNSMRFAVFRHTEQLDTLIATIQMQYGSGAENPVVTELKGIRGVLDSINTKFDSVIGRNGNQKGIRIAT